MQGLTGLTGKEGWRLSVKPGRIGEAILELRYPEGRSAFGDSLGSLVDADPVQAGLLTLRLDLLGMEEASESSTAGVYIVSPLLRLQKEETLIGSDGKFDLNLALEFPSGDLEVIPSDTQPPEFDDVYAKPEA